MLAPITKTRRPAVGIHDLWPLTHRCGTWVDWRCFCSSYLLNTEPTWRDFKKTRHVLKEISVSSNPMYSFIFNFVLFQSFSQLIYVRSCLSVRPFFPFSLPLLCPPSFSLHVCVCVCAFSFQQEKSMACHPVEWTTARKELGKELFLFGFFSHFSSLSHCFEQIKWRRVQNVYITHGDMHVAFSPTYCHWNAYLLWLFSG